MIRKVIAKRSFKLEGNGLEVTIDKEDIGELIGSKKPGKGFPIIIKDKTIYIKDRKLLRYLFKVE